MCRLLTIEKNLLNSNISPPRSRNMVNLGPLTAEICSGLWGTPSKFQRVSRLGFVTAPTSVSGSQPNFARCLAVSWAGTPYIHFWGRMLPNGILPGAKITLRPSLAFSYISSVTARHSSIGRQPNFTAWYKEWNFRTFTDDATYMAGRPSRWASAYICSCGRSPYVIGQTGRPLYFCPVIMAALRSRCGHYIFIYSSFIHHKGRSNKQRDK